MCEDVPLDSGSAPTVDGSEDKHSVSRQPALKTLGPYEILEEVGRGGMGVVYKAFHPQLKRTVALKVLIAGEDASEEAITRFHREAEAVARLGHHPNIVPVYDIGQVVRAQHAAPLHYFAMHYVDGKSLDRLIDDGEIAPKRAAVITKKIAEALAQAHGQGILHRDVKPANILVDPQGEPQITDFGLAKDLASETKMTQSGMTLGTPNYMPPEQADGRLDDIDERSDVFSLGATFYEMLTLQPPFTGSGVMEVIHKVLTRDPVSPRRGNPSIPRDLETICLTCLEKNPEKRYASARELGEDLDRFLERRPILARPVPAWEKVLRRMGRNKVASAFFVALALVLGASAVGGWIGVNALLAERKEKETAKDEKADELKARIEAEANEKETDRLKDKAHRVSRVLNGMHARLGPAHIELKRAYYGMPKIEGRVNSVYDGHREDIETFCAGVPKDGASRATMLAVKAWLLRYGGYKEEARDLLKESQALDEEVPWGFLFEAMILLSAYVVDQPLPPLTISSDDSFSFLEPPKESAWARKARERIQVLLEKVSKAPVWGDSSSRDLEVVIAGFAGIPRGDHEAAERGLTKALEVMELSWVWENVLFARAKVRYSRRKFPDGLSDIKRILKDYPDNPDAFNFKGSLLIGEGLARALEGFDPRVRFGEAIDAHTESLKRNPHHAATHLYRARAHWTLGEVLKTKGEDPRATYRDAVKDCGEVLRLDPEIWDAHYLRGGVLWSLGQIQANAGEDPRESFRRAIEDLTAALPKAAKEARVRCLRGLLHRSLGDAQRALGQDPRPSYGRSIEDCSLALQADPKCDEAYYIRGLAHQSLGDTLVASGEAPWDSYERSIRDSTEALRLKPDYSEAYHSRASTYWSLGQAQMKNGIDPRESYLRAVEDCEEALRINPRFALAFMCLGNAHSSLGDVRKSRGEDPLEEYRTAVEEFGKALARNSGWSLGYYNRASTLLTLAEAEARRNEDPRPSYRNAVEDCNEALRMNPRSARSQVVRGLACAGIAKAREARGMDSREKYGEAIDSYTAALGLEPGDPGALANRASSLQALGWARESRGETAKDLYERALADFRLAIKGIPSMFQIHFNMGRILVTQGRPAEAAKEFEKAVSKCPRKLSILNQWLLRAQVMAEVSSWVRDLSIGDDVYKSGFYISARDLYEKGLLAAENGEKADLDEFKSSHIRGHYNLACILSQASIGRKGKLAKPKPVPAEESGELQGKVLAHLRKALELGYSDLDHIRKDPLLAPIRDRPEFKALLREYEEKLKKE